MCLGLGGDEEQRDLMGNLVPPNQKARDLKTTLSIILGVHFFVAILKCVIIGILSGLSDILSCLILWCAICKFDYCNCLIYCILVLFDLFQLLVLLGYYFQTEQGKKLPRRKRDGTYVDPDADKDDKNHPKSAQDKQDEKDRHERESVKENDMKKRDGDNRQNMSEREAQRDMDREEEVKRREGVEADPHGTGSFIKKSPGFVAGVIVALVIFYLVAIYYAFQAYKEFKDIAEQAAGGPSNLNEGANIMAYGTLEPREQRDRAREDARARNRRRNPNGRNEPARPHNWEGEGHLLGGE